MKNFKWYRKLRGGTWYLNLYTYETAHGGFKRWEREAIGFRGAVIKTEIY